MDEHKAARRTNPRAARQKLAVVSLTLVVGGCMGGSQADTRFPTAAEIGQIGDAPPPRRVSNPGQKEVDTWDLKDPPSSAPDAAPRAPSGPWEKVLADAAAKRQGLLWVSDSMHCLAKQTGHFFLAHNAIPADDLTRFMAARCGVADGDVGFSYLSGTSPAGTTDDARFQSERTMLEDLVSKHLSSGSQVAGIWAGRDGNKTVVILPFGPRRARLDKVPASPLGNHVVIAGELLTPAEHLQGLGTYGKFGFRQCTVDERVRLPRFSMDCETNADDPSTTIEIAAFPAGRVIGRFVANLVVWPEGKVPNQYVRPASSFAQVGTGPDFPANLVGPLNQVRKEAGLGPVVFNAQESNTAARVAPHYFAALNGSAPEANADTIVLGLRAGWQISGLVGHGHFTSSLTRKLDPGALLASSLSRPSGRETLLDPDVKVIAIGPVLSKEEGILAGVFSTYSLLEPTATQKEVGQVVALLNAQRKTRGLGPVTVVESLQGVAAGTARSIELGQRSPEDAMEDLMQKSAATLGGGVQAWFVGADKAERFTFPKELLGSPIGPHRRRHRALQAQGFALGRLRSTHRHVGGPANGREGRLGRPCGLLNYGHDTAGGHSVPTAAQTPHLPSQQYSPCLHDFDPHDSAPPSLAATEASPVGIADDTAGSVEASDPHPPSVHTKAAPQKTRLIAITCPVKLDLSAPWTRSSIQQRPCPRRALRFCSANQGSSSVRRGPPRARRLDYQNLSMTRASTTNGTASATSSASADPSTTAQSRSGDGPSSCRSSRRSAFLRWAFHTKSSSTEIIGRPPAQPSILKAFGRIHLFPRPTPQHANALARQFADSANNLANAKRRRARWPKQKPWAIHSRSVPVACQRATNVQASAEARCQALPLHPLLLPRAFASTGQLPLSSKRTTAGRNIPRAH